MYVRTTPKSSKKGLGIVVYFIQQGGEGPIKIGYCQERGQGVLARLHTLQTGNPERLYLRGTLPTGGRETERALHRAFASDRLMGEWFKPSTALDGLIVLVEAANNDNDKGMTLRVTQALEELGARPKGRPSKRRQRKPTKAERRTAFDAAIDDGSLVIKQMPADS